MSLKQWKYTNGYEPYETLPEVNSEDNGKVVGVADGAYALVNGGGGGGSAEPLIVKWNDDTGIDASYNEIKTAMLAGKNVYAVYNFTEPGSTGTNYYKILDFNENSVDEEGTITHHYFACAIYGIDFSNNVPSMVTFYSQDADADMGFYGAGGI